MGGEPNVWGTAERRDGSSDWASTGHSTLSGEVRATPARTRRRRSRRSFYRHLLLPLLLLLGLAALAGRGVFGLAQHLHL